MDIRPNCTITDQNFSMFYYDSSDYDGPQKIKIKD